MMIPCDVTLGEGSRMELCRSEDTHLYPFYGGVGVEAGGNTLKAGPYRLYHETQLFESLDYCVACCGKKIQILREWKC